MSVQRSDITYEQVSSSTSIGENEKPIDKKAVARANLFLLKFVIFLEAISILAMLSIAIVMPIYWNEKSSTLTEFAMGSEKLGLPMLVIVEILAAIVIAFCLLDVQRRIRKWNSLKDDDQIVGRKTRENDKVGNKKSKATENGGCESSDYNRESPMFFLREMMKNLDNKSLMEIALLAKNATEEARRKRLCPQENQINFLLDSFSEYLSGILVHPRQNDATSHSLRATVVLAGSPCVGKSSIFSRILFDKYNAEVIPTLGIDYGLKTLKISGKNMFGKDVSLDVGMRVWDTAGSDTDKGLSLTYFRDHVILIVVCDVMDGSSIQGLVWWVLNFRSKVHDPHVAVFLNKIDLEDRMVTAEDLIGIPALQGVDIYEVSAKTGEGILESYTQVVCRAICHEAEQIVESGIQAQSNSRIFNI